MSESYTKGDSGMKLSTVLRRTMNKLFDPFWDFYYKHHQHAPKRFHKDDEWILEHWDENPYDPICFPLPLGINCLGCRGCSLNRHPLFAPPPRGPYKLAISDTFANQYKELFGDEALFEFMWKFEKHNQEIELQRSSPSLKSGGN